MVIFKNVLINRKAKEVKKKFRFQRQNKYLKALKAVSGVIKDLLNNSNKSQVSLYRDKGFPILLCLYPFATC